MFCSACSFPPTRQLLLIVFTPDHNAFKMASLLIKWLIVTEALFLDDLENRMSVDSSAFAVVYTANSIKVVFPKA